MSVKRQRSTDQRAQLALFENPYAFIELESETQEQAECVFTSEQKHAYLRQLQNPYAYHAIFDEVEEDSTKNLCVESRDAHNSSVSNPEQAPKTIITAKELEIAVDKILAQYKPHVARDHWAQVVDYRQQFLTEATRTEETMSRVAENLRRLQLDLMPGERVEYNRAPATRIIAQLENLLH